MNARSASLRTGMAVCPHSALAEGPAACFVGAPAREERQAPQETQQPQFPPQPGRPLFLSRRSTAAAPAARRHSPNRTRIVLIASFPLSVLCSDLCRDRFGQPGRFMIRAEEQIKQPGDQDDGGDQSTDLDAAGEGQPQLIHDQGDHTGEHAYTRWRTRSAWRCPFPA